MIIRLFRQRWHTDAQRRVHKILPLCEFQFRGYLKSVRCYVLPKTCYINPTCVKYSQIIKELNDSQMNSLALHIKNSTAPDLRGAIFVLVSIFNQYMPYKDGCK